MSSELIRGRDQAEAVSDLVALLTDGNGVRSDIDPLLRELGGYFEADRVYLLEYTSEGLPEDSLLQWDREGKNDAAELLSESRLRWERALSRCEGRPPVIDGCYAGRHPERYLSLLRPGVASLIAAPIRKGDSVEGYICVEQPRLHADHTLLLSTAGALLHSRLHELRLRERRRLDSSIMDMVGRAYYAVYFMELATGTYREVVVQPSAMLSSIIPSSGSAIDGMERMLARLVVPEQAEEVRAFMCLSTLSERLNDRYSISVHFISPFTGWCEGSFIAAERDGEGRCTHVLWTVRSIQRERERSEQMEALSREQTDQLRLMSTLSRDYLNVYLIRPEERLIEILKLEGYVTSGLLKGEHVMYPYEATCAKYIADRVHPQDVEGMRAVMQLSNIRARLATDGEYVGTYRVLDRGETHYYQYKYLPVEGTDRILAGFRNVDDMIRTEKERQAELQAALDDARRADAAKTAFLSRMSHDMRTPLNGILGILEIAEQHSEDRELLASGREKAKVAAKHLLSLISDVLELAKLDEDRVDLAHEPIALPELVRDVLTITQLRAAEAGVTLRYPNGLSRPRFPYVYGSPLHIRQILLNILGNCVKYNRPNGSVSFSAEELGVENGRVTYRVTISDTGIGMSEDFLQRLFEPFAQECNDARSTLQGTGLGMSIVKRLLDRMGGTISVTSRRNVGSCFIITLGFEIAEAPVAEETKAHSREGLIDTQILLVEDNELNMEIAELLLTDLGAVVTKAVNGREAVERFAESEPGRFDVILMDLMMPVMDGYAATTAIRALERPDARRIPIVAMTANAFAEDVKRCLETGMDAHIAKPVEIENLIDTLDRVLKGK